MSLFTTFKHVWLRCLLVSIVVSIIMPLFTFSIVVSEEEMDVPSLENIDPDAIAEMTPEEREVYLNNNVKMKKLTGFDRYIYPFTHPQIWYFYRRAVFLIFVFVFIATVTSSSLCLQYFEKHKS